jgi:hypothetical protein
MMRRKAEKKEHNKRQSADARKGNALVISSKIMADLKNKGILVFKQLTDDEQKMVWKWSKEVIRQYRNVLEADPSNIRRIENLPFAKDDIKLAIKLSLPLYISKDMQSMVRILRTAYKETGAFQSIDPKVVERRATVSAAQEAPSIEEQSQNELRYEDRLMELVVSEKKALLQEINDLIIQLETLA